MSRYSPFRTAMYEPFPHLGIVSTTVRHAGSFTSGTITIPHRGDLRIGGWLHEYGCVWEIENIERDGDDAVLRVREVERNAVQEAAE